MADDKTQGGVTTTEEGDTYPTQLSDSGRAAQVAALKNEHSALSQRAATGDETAKRRLAEVEKTLGQFRERPARGDKPETA